MSDKNKIALTEAAFHNAIHADVGEPQKVYETTGFDDIEEVETERVHEADWAESTVDLSAKKVLITVYINFKKTNLEPEDYNRLKSLAKKGISKYWSRAISVNGQQFQVEVKVQNRKKDSIDVKLRLNDSEDGKRSNNSGLWDARIYYNRGLYLDRYGYNEKLASSEDEAAVKNNHELKVSALIRADENFMYTSAHEFGHSVLEYFGGKSLSWGHKGTTKKILQSVKPSAPSYPKNGNIDLMKYFNGRFPSDFYSRNLVVEKDLKRLIWLSKVNFI